MLVSEKKLSERLFLKKAFYPKKNRDLLGTYPNIIALILCRNHHCSAP